MTALESRNRWLLRAYPRWYRRNRGEEMLGTLMEASEPGRRWPSARDARALITGGLRVRSGLGGRLTAAAALRQALLLGAGLALTSWVASEFSNVILGVTHNELASGDGSEVAFGLLTVAVVAAAWLAPRWAAAALALAGAALYLVLWGDTVMAISPAMLMTMTAGLVLGPERLPRSWLGLAGAFFAGNLLKEIHSVFTPAPPPITRQELRQVFLAHRAHQFPHLPGQHAGILAIATVLLPWLVFAAALLWGVLDARVTLALTVYLLFTWPVIDLLDYLDVHSGGLSAWQWAAPAAGAAVLAVVAAWRLRRQAAI
jgi:hypothetical protein